MIPIKKILILNIILLLAIASNLVLANTINIALVIPLTGNYAGYGTQLLAGAAQAVKEINNSGGVLNNTLEIIPYDDKCLPKLASTIAKQLAKNQNIHAIIGHVTSATTLAALDNYAHAKKLLITATATNPQITQKNITTVFRMTGRDDNQGLVIAKFLANDLQSNRIAIVHEQDLYGKELANYVIEHLTTFAKQPILLYEVPRGTKDYTKLLAKLQALKIDAVFFAALYPEVGNLANAMQTQQLQIPLITGDSIALNSFITAAGNRQAITSVIMCFGNDGKNIATNSSLIQKMRNAHLEVNGYSLYAYSAVQAIAAAIQATKSTNGVKLANWLHHNTVNTALGLKAWDTNGDIIDAEFKMYLWNKERYYQPLQLTNN